jgi:uncharacterized protein (UPF0335 family)
MPLDPKKRKVSPLTPSTTPKRTKTEKTQAGIQNRFSRIDRESVKFASDELKDNSFEAAAHGYGLKAHQDLIVTRGKGFRKEKDKKKRGSYKGGTIDFVSRSFKFEDSD